MIAPARPGVLATRLALLLVCLQLIAPFLHAHRGDWHVAGVHVDAQVARLGGGPAHSAPPGRVTPPSGEWQMSASAAPADVGLQQDESPAVGVAGGLRDDPDPQPIVVALAVAVLLWPLAPRRPARRRLPASPESTRFVPRRRPANAPPPAIAPPSLR